MNYEPIFKLPYSNIIIIDLLFKSGYNYLDALMTLQEGSFDLYLPEETVKKESQARYNDIIKGESLIKFEKDAKEAINTALNLGKIDIFKLPREDFINFLKNFFIVAGKSIYYYQKTENFYFRKIEEELEKFCKDKYNLDEVLSKDFDLSSWPDDKIKLAESVRIMSKLKFELREMINPVFIGNNSILSVICQKLVLETGREDSLCMTFDEVISFLEGKSIRDTTIRNLFSCVTWDKILKKIDILEGEEAQKKIIDLAKEMPKNQLSGKCASRGYVKGKAKIFHSSLNPEKLDFSKMEKGDILVSDTTGPELMSAIKKASAIVTDEGGLMSHAALVSREFKIPCIVGTKYATEVFKDGDLIEVDADKGTVKKLFS